MIKMSKYLVNPIQVKMKESKKGSIYESIVAMGFRARQINDDMRYEWRLKMQDIMQSNEENDSINPDQTEISMSFERYPKATFLAMHEMFSDKLTFNYSNSDDEQTPTNIDKE